MTDKDAGMSDIGYQIADSRYQIAGYSLPASGIRHPASGIRHPFQTLGLADSESLPSTRNDLHWLERAVVKGSEAHLFCKPEKLRLDAVS